MHAGRMTVTVIGWSFLGAVAGWLVAGAWLPTGFPPTEGPRAAKTSALAATRTAAAPDERPASESGAASDGAARKPDAVTIGRAIGRGAPQVSRKDEAEWERELVAARAAIEDEYRQRRDAIAAQHTGAHGSAEHLAALGALARWRVERSRALLRELHAGAGPDSPSPPTLDPSVVQRIGEEHAELREALNRELVPGTQDYREAVWAVDRLVRERKDALVAATGAETAK